ncbi:MAG: GIY-YIG nuclease family protein [Calditrichaeota bacterium]|nr:GIY-YIG nuclease family protein [Calditrichota bacterium]
MYHTYVLKSLSTLSTKKLYIGQTGNLKDRLKRHNENRSKATKGRGPWRLIFARRFENRSDAVKLEKQLKNYKSKRYVLEWIQKNKSKKDFVDLPQQFG